MLLKRLSDLKNRKLHMGMYWKISRVVGIASNIRECRSRGPSPSVTCHLDHHKLAASESSIWTYLILPT